MKSDLISLFIKFLILSISGLLFQLTSAYSCSNESSTVDVPIIIIGAGAAGLSAAQRLYDAGFRNVTIFEAENRIGGRVYSYGETDDFVELGAQYVHGVNQMLYNFVLENYLLDQSPSINISDGFLLYSESKKSLTEHDVLDIRNRTNLFIAITNSLTRKDDLAVNIIQNCSVEEVRGPLYSSTVGDASWKDEAYDYEIRAEMSWTAAPTPHHLSIRSHADYSQKGDNFKLRSNVSLMSVLNKMTGSFPREWIRYGLRVDEPNSIRLLSDHESDQSTGRVAVTVDGSVYYADHVIDTVSLGVLKMSLDRFQPSLAEAKIDAIKKAGFGPVTKIFVTFAAPFWKNISPKGVDGYGLIFSDQYLNSLQTDIWNLPNSKTLPPPWYRYLIHFSIITSSVDTILLWAGGRGALLVDQMSDEDVLTDIENVLPKFLGGITPPKPIRIRRHAWSKNPSFRGAYSYFSLESSKSGYTPLSLATPDWSYEKQHHRGNKAYSLLFAGEATHPYYFSTVHGAMKSGQREANRIIGYYYEDRCSNNVSIHLCGNDLFVALLATVIFTAFRN